MFDYKSAIYKKLIHYNDNRLKLHLRYPKTYLLQKLNKHKGSTLKIYHISYRTNTSTLKSTAYS